MEASRIVGYAVDDAVATITLNRPDAMNSLDSPTKEALRDRVLEAAGDTNIRAVVLTGSGRAFCAGQDLKEHANALRSGDSSLATTLAEHYIPIAEALATMPKPVIAAVNGAAVGAGMALACACDIRIVATSASFNTAFAAIGLSCDTGLSWTLPRLLGHGRAVSLLYLPRTVPASEALDIGLASEVVDDGDLLTRALQLARELAAGPTVAYAAMRDALTYSAAHTLAESMAHEGALIRSAGDTADHQNAVAAFIEKRRPEFHGR